ncbi:MAG: D-alanyl-D-alanine carboxypeptidase, partial [Bdellovibrionota bacterium]
MTKIGFNFESFVTAMVLASSILLSHSAKADDSKLTTDVRKTLKRLGSGTKSFCYVVEDGSVQGVNPDQPVKIASVMKVLTTLWAVDKLGPNYRYTTKVYWQASNKELHIAGSNDPFFDRDRLYLLLSDLNTAGIKSIERLTTDSNFLVNMDLFEHVYDPSKARAYLYTEAHADAPLGGLKVKETLENSFNTSKWWSGRKNRYAKARAKHPTSKFLSTVSMTTEDVDIV